MQNFIKSQTRLAFIQYIFQSEFLESDCDDNIEEETQNNLVDRGLLEKIFGGVGPRRELSSSP